MSLESNFNKKKLQYNTIKRYMTKNILDHLSKVCTKFRFKQVIF